MKAKKLILWIFAILISLVIVLYIAGYILVGASLPAKEGSIIVKGIHDDVEIIFDEKGIPQIYTGNESDAWFTVGWLHASDRLFQMELTRRVAGGQLSGVLGEITLEIDRRQRIIGHQRIAESDLKNLREPYRTYLQSYVDGVNAWVEQSSALPFEYHLLGIDFEPWRIVDCLMIISFQTWFSDALQNNDEFFQQLTERLGSKKVAGLFADHPEHSTKTVPPQAGTETGNDQMPPAVDVTKWQQYLFHSLFHNQTLPFLRSRASNAWVVSAKKSQSGSAIFANDPHLEISRLPQFWYFLAIHVGTDLNVMGITTPGLPDIVMGHNRKSAWGFTAAGTDITDHYRLKLNPHNADEYLFNDQYIPFEEKIEYVAVKGRASPDTLIVKISRYGPVTGKSEERDEVYTQYWAGFDFSPSAAIAAGFEMAKIENFSQFRKNVTNFGALDANWLYADHHGNIGYQLGSPIPIRSAHDAYGKLPGWNDSTAWKGYYKLDLTPHAFNPEKGWLANCNNKVKRQDSPFELHGNFADDRIRRITELLSQSEAFRVEDMKNYQLDVKSVTYQAWKQEAIRILEAMDKADKARQLVNWLGTAAKTSSEAALLETWLVLLKRYTFGDESKDLMDKFMNRILYRDRHFRHVYFNNPQDWFDDKRTEDKVESKEDIAVKAMYDALEMSAGKFWGDMQTLTMAHPMAAVPVLSSLLALKRGPFPREGTIGSLNNSGASWNEEELFKCQGGPSFRFILNFNDIDKTQMVLPAGQSGHPMSKHFFDFYDLWANGEYWTVPFHRPAVEKGAASRLWLKSAGQHQSDVQ